MPASASNRASSSGRLRGNNERVEAAKRLPISGALVQDRGPAQASLCPLKDQELKQPSIIVQRRAPRSRDTPPCPDHTAHPQRSIPDSNLHSHDRSRSPDAHTQQQVLSGDGGRSGALAQGSHERYRDPVRPALAKSQSDGGTVDGRHFEQQPGANQSSRATGIGINVRGSSREPPAQPRCLQGLRHSRLCPRSAGTIVALVIGEKDQAIVDGQPRSLVVSPRGAADRVQLTMARLAMPAYSQIGPGNNPLNTDAIDVYRVSVDQAGCANGGPTLSPAKGT